MKAKSLKHKTQRLITFGGESMFQANSVDAIQQHLLYSSHYFLLLLSSSSLVGFSNRFLKVVIILPNQ